MNWSIVRRALTVAMLTAFAALLVGAWLAPATTLWEFTQPLPTAFEVTTLTYRAIASVLLLASAALAVLIGWSWSTRPTRHFALKDGGTLTVTDAATLLRQALIRRVDVRSAEVVVEHRSAGLAPRMTIDVTADALIAEIETHARDTALSLAARVNVPLVDLEVALTFQELNLVAARKRRDATRSRRARAA